MEDDGTNMRMRSLVLALLAVSISLPALAGSAKGKVTDLDGNPIVGATVKITRVAPPNTTWDATTDKKGTFWFPMLVYTPPGDYEVTIGAADYFTGKIKAVSRAADRTLLGEFESKIRVGVSKIQVRVTGLGEATLDFTLSKEKAPEAAAQAAAVQDPWDIGRDKFQRGDYPGAVDPLQKAVEAASEDPDRRQLYAYTLLKLDRLGEAEAQAARAAQLAPEKTGANLILAEIYKEKGDNPKAWDALQKERSLAPESVRVLERVASLAAEMGKIDEAIPAAEAVTRLKPDDAEGWIALGSLYAEKKEMDKSEQAFRKVVELDPANAAQIFYNIGVVLTNKADMSDADNRKAVEAFRKAVGAKPDYAAAHRELAYALLRSGDTEGARQGLERYLQLEPKASDAAEIQSMVKSLTKKK